MGSLVWVWFFFVKTFVFILNEKDKSWIHKQVLKHRKVRGKNELQIVLEHSVNPILHVNGGLW